MATKANKNAYKAIKELMEVTLRTRQDAKRVKELRDDAIEEAKALYKAMNWAVGTDQSFEGGTVRLYTETVYTWEKNHKIKDALIDVYCAQYDHLQWLEQQVKKARAELKSTGKLLEEAHPDSDSIKNEHRFQIR